MMQRAHIILGLSYAGSILGQQGQQGTMLDSTFLIFEKNLLGFFLIQASGPHDFRVCIFSSMP